MISEFYSLFFFFQVPRKSCYLYREEEGGDKYGRPCLTIYPMGPTEVWNLLILATCPTKFDVIMRPTLSERSDPYGCSGFGA